MDIKTILSIWLALGLATIYLPWLFCLREKKATGRDLERLRPRLGRVGIWFPALYVAWVLLSLWATLSFSSMLGQAGIHLVGAWIAGMALFNGLFTLRTQVVPLPLPIQYLYVVGRKARSVGRIQVIAALVQIVVSVCVTAVLNP